jgi:hypothetical protein
MEVVSGMTRRGAIAAAIGLAGAAGAWAAAAKEFWDEKFPENWSKEEIEQLLNNSPWAQKAAINFNGGPGGAGGFLFGGAIAPGAAVQYEGAGAAKNEGGKFFATATWESAKPLCDARKSTPDGAREFFIIGLTGNFPDAAKPEPDEATSAEEARVEMLRTYTKLERKGDSPIYLDHMQPQKDGEWFYFSRLEGIKMANKEITFTTKLGPLEFKAKFTLKDMMYRGKLAI